MVQQFGWDEMPYVTEVIEFVAFLATARLHRQVASTTQSFVKAYPVASFLCFVLTMMSPGLFLDICLGKPILLTVTCPKIWLYSFITFCLCFFSPRDLFWDLMNSKFGKMLIDIIKDIHRILVAIDVTSLVSKQTGQYYFGPFIVAALKNTMAIQVLYVVEQLIRGDTLKKHELKTLSYSFRLSIFTALFCNMVRYFKAVPIEALTFSYFSQLGDTELMLRFATVVIAMRVAYHFGYDPLYPKMQSLCHVKEVYASITERVASVRSPSVARSPSTSGYSVFNSSRNSSFEDSAVSTPMPAAPAKKAAARGGKAPAKRGRAR